jgi:hypothetical protein
MEGRFLHEDPTVNKEISKISRKSTNCKVSSEEGQNFAYIVYKNRQLGIVCLGVRYVNLGALRNYLNYNEFEDRNSCMTGLKTFACSLHVMSACTEEQKRVRV